MRRDLLLVAALLGTLAPGCSASPATQLVVVVDTDYAIPSGLDQIDVDVQGPDGTHHVEHQPMVSSAALPYTLTVVPSGAALGPVTVRASGSHGGTEVVWRTGRVTLVAGQSSMLRLWLLRTCDVGAHAACTGDTTCGDDGLCHGVDVGLDPWTGVAPRIGTDAGVTPDGGPHDANVPDAGDAHVAQPDTGADCRMTGCDDHEACTDDVCGTDGHCTFSNNSLACDDHVFCNGMDTCGAGSCSVHAGSPCGAGMCDEASSHCGTCTHDSDCPSPMMGTFGACGGFSDGCATTGTHSRSVQTFACTGGSCVPATSTDTQPCTRTTDGTMCGSTSCGAFGVCTNTTDVCTLSGTQSRTCTDMVCSSGTCGGVARMESAACTRASTDGTTCMATSCTAFGACNYAMTCSTSATQARTCTDYVCAAGACGSAMRADTQACSRVTDGTVCSATSCTAWSTCAYVLHGCAPTGPQTRTCTDYACATGACASTMRTEMQACPNRPSGTDCANMLTQCGTYACNATGSCLPTGGQCTGSQPYCCHDDPPYCTTNSSTCFLR